MSSSQLVRVLALSAPSHTRDLSTRMGGMFKAIAKVLPAPQVCIGTPFFAFISIVTLKLPRRPVSGMRSLPPRLSRCLLNRKRQS